MNNFIVADLSLFSLKWLKFLALLASIPLFLSQTFCLRPRHKHNTKYTNLQRCDYHLLLMKDTIQGHVKQRILPSVMIVSPIKYCPMLRK